MEWLVLFITAVLLNCGGQRCLQVIILPLLVVEVIALFRESGHFKQKLPGGRYLPTAYVGSLVLAFLVSCLYGGRGDYAAHLQKTFSVPIYLYILSLHTLTLCDLRHLGIIQSRISVYSGVRQIAVHTVDLGQILAAAFRTHIHLQLLVSAVITVGQ